MKVAESSLISNSDGELAVLCRNNSDSHFTNLHQVEYLLMLA